MTLVQQFEKWVVSDILLEIIFIKNNKSQRAITKLVKYNEDTKNILAYDVDHKQLLNIGIYEIESIEEYKS